MHFSILLRLPRLVPRSPARDSQKGLDTPDLNPPTLDPDSQPRQHSRHFKRKGGGGGLGWGELGYYSKHNIKLQNPTPTVGGVGGRGGGGGELGAPVISVIRLQTVSTRSTISPKPSALKPKP